MTAAQDALRRERDEAVDDLLSRFHWWQGRARVGRGFNRRSLVVGEYTASRQYDDENGALDDELEDQTMRQVEFEVSQLGDPWRSAIHAIAKSLCTGAAVFHSPRIAAADHARVSAEAREQLLRRFVAAGLI